MFKHNYYHTVVEENDGKVYDFIIFKINLDKYEDYLRSMIFCKERNSENFLIYSFYPNVLDIERINDEIKKNKKYFNKLSKLLRVQGRITLDGKIYLQTSGFVSNYQHKSVFFELIALGLSLDAIGLGSFVDLSFLNEKLEIKQPIMRHDKGRFQSYLTGEVYCVDVLEREENNLCYDFVISGAEQVKGMIHLVKEIYPNIKEVEFTFNKLWDYYCLCEIVSFEASKKKNEGKADIDLLVHYENKRDKEFFLKGIEGMSDNFLNNLVNTFVFLTRFDCFPAINEMFIKMNNEDWSKETLDVNKIIIVSFLRTNYQFRYKISGYNEFLEKSKAYLIQNSIEPKSLLHGIV